MILKSFLHLLAVNSMAETPFYIFGGVLVQTSDDSVPVWDVIQQGVDRASQISNPGMDPMHLLFIGQISYSVKYVFSMDGAHFYRIVHSQ